jgi:hypothetical protein
LLSAAPRNELEQAHRHAALGELKGALAAGQAAAHDRDHFALA